MSTLIVQTFQHLGKLLGVYLGFALMGVLLAFFYIFAFGPPQSRITVLFIFFSVAVILILILNAFKVLLSRYEDISRNAALGDGTERVHSESVSVRKRA